MVAGVHDAQHSQAVSPLRLRAGGRRRPSCSGSHAPPTRPSPSASPPYPIATDSAPAHRRRARSFNRDDKAAYFATSVASRSVSRLNDHC